MTPERPAPARTRTVLPLPRQGGHDRPVGQVLVQRGLLAEDQLAWALEVQQRTRSRLGEVLVSSGLVSRMDLHRALARAWDLPFVDVPGTILDPALVAGLDHAELSSQGWLPLHRGRDGRVLVAVTERPGPALRARVETHLGAEVDFAVTSTWDIAKGLTTLYRDAIVDEAAHGLWRRSPRRSALSVPSRGLLVVLAALAALLLGAGLLAPAAVLAGAVVVLAAGHLLGLGSLVVLTLAGRERPAAPLPADDVLPVHTVLVPVPHGTGGTPAGAAALAATLSGLTALDYPVDRLEVLLLVEEGDTATRACVTAAGVPETVTFLSVPRGGPATRALACNVGLFFARGELLVVLDVGDVPAPDQLRAAAAALRPRPEDRDPLVGVQARVELRGPRLRPLAALRTLERVHRARAAAGQAALGLPLPLGGAGSHVRTEVLRRLGGWDPFNDAEDADLGVRAARAGLRVDVLPSRTVRRATGGVRGWTAATARALTGRAQATLVHLRRHDEDEGPVGAGRRLRPLVAAAGGTSLLGPAPWGLLLGLVLAAGVLSGRLPDVLVLPALAVLVAGGVLTAAVAAGAALAAGRPGLLVVAPLVPLLGVLQAVAAALALLRLLRGPGSRRAATSPGTPVPRQRTPQQPASQ